MLDSYPTAFAGIQVHVGDSYATAWGSTRATFYNVEYTPTAWFDGVLSHIGAPGSYAPEYDARHAIPSDVTMLVGAVEVTPPTSPPTYEVQVSLKLESTGTARTVRVHAVQVLDYYPASPSYSRNCFRNATASEDVFLTPGQSVLVTKTLHIDAASAATPGSMTLLAWAQAPNASGPAEVYQAAIMDYPFEPLYALKISLPEGLPEFIPPDAPTQLSVRIQNGTEDLVPGTEMICYRYDAGAFTTAPLAPAGGEFFTATLPSPGCGAEPEFYFSAQGGDGGVVTLPAAAPTDLLTTTVTVVTDVIIDDCEGDLGWTVWNDSSVTAGWWERAIPLTSGVIGCPLADYDGSGRCYLTDNRSNQDLDGGPTILTSPTLDLSIYDDVYVRFACWMYCDDPVVGQDFLDISLSDNGGATWILSQHLPGQGGWLYSQLRVRDFIELSAEFQIRFSLSDNPNNSRTEGALDDIWIFDLSCPTTPPYDVGDLNCDHAVNVFDIDPFVLALTAPAEYAADFPNCDYLLADINGDDAVNAFDIDPFVIVLTGSNQPPGADTSLLLSTSRHGRARRGHAPPFLPPVPKFNSASPAVQAG